MFKCILRIPQTMILEPVQSRPNSCDSGLSPYSALGQKEEQE